MKNKKTLIIIISVVAFILLLFINIILSNNDRKIIKVINSYFNSITNNDYKEANEYLENYYDFSNTDYFNAENENLYLSKLQYKVVKVNIKKDYAIAIINLRHPSITKILSEYADYLSVNLFKNNTLEEQVYKKQLLESKELEYEIDEVTLSLRKKQNSWVIVIDDNFKSILNNGKSNNVNINNLSNIEQEKIDMLNYIENYLILNNYKVGYSSSYSKEKVPSIKNIEIKNDGTKEIMELTLEIRFFDDNNNVVAIRDITPINSFTSSLKANYYWKMDNDRFYEINNIDTNINMNKCDVKISSVKFATNSSVRELTDEEIYIRDYMEIKSYEVKKYTKYTYEKVPGLGNLTIKNMGGKNLSKVYVTIYFQDENGNDIADNEILVIGGLFADTLLLKANYSWKMDNDMFYELTNLSSEVNLSRNRIAITQIEFED